MTWQRISTFFVITTIVGMCPNVFAQSGAGTIEGNVHDPSGASVPGVKIHVTNADTGQVRDTISNGKGYYVVPELFTGAYRVETEAPHFNKWTGDLYLQAGQAAVVDPALTITGANQQISVTEDETNLVTYDRPTISNTLEYSRINQLPMNGRNIQTLVGITTPGVEPGGYVNGNMPSAFEYIQDGAALANRDSGGATLTPDPDAIQEVSVETSNSSAKFNRPATAIIATKSGTNQLHGTFFETARNNAFGIAKARQDTFTKAPHYVRNEFGGSVGGPILIPKLYDGRGKSFFFAAYERYSLRQGVTLLGYVPTMAMRQGDFSGLISSNGNPYTVYDSLTTNSSTSQRQAFTNNQIPMSRISPLAKDLYAITPGPTTSDNPLVAPNWIGPTPNETTTPTVTIRLDHRFDEANTAFLRFTDNRQQTLATSNSGEYGVPTTNGAANLSQTPINVTSFAISYTHVFSPTFFSETVLANTWERDFTGAAGNQNVDYITQLGLPNNFGQLGFPYVIGGAMGASQNSLFQGFNSGIHRDNSQITTVLDENLTKIVGRHQFEFGGRYRHERIGIFPDQLSNQATFSSQGTGLLDPSTGSAFGQLPYTGLASADFFLGAAQSYGVPLNQGYYHFRDQEIASYFQDDFHVTSKLLLNLGLRWEIHPALHEEHNYLSGFDVANKGIVLGQPLTTLYGLGATTPSVIASFQNVGVKFEDTATAGVPSGIFYNNIWTFGPRLGAAYRLFGDRHTTVLRGGYGTYIYPPPVRNFYARTVDNPPYSAEFTQSYSNAAQSPDGKANYLLRSPQTVIAGQNSSGVVNTSGTNAFTPGINISSLTSHYPVTYVQQYNLTLEQQLKPDAALRISFIGDHGSNLEQYNELNTSPSSYVWYVRTGQPLATGYYSSVAQNPYDNTTYSQVEIQQKTGYSNDYSGQINYQRLYNHGYAFQLYYTFSSAFRNGGNGWRDSFIYPAADFAPGSGAPIGNTDQLNHYLNYIRDTTIPKHRIRWNFVVDLPLGNDKYFLPHANRLVNEVVGGWQIAGDGSVNSQFFGLEASNWGPVTPTHIYKHKYPVNDCRSGVCYKSYLYYNGYIPPSQVNGPKGVGGIPANYVANQTPLITDSTSKYYLTNDVTVPLDNGTSVVTSYSPGPGVHPFSKTYLPGPFNWTQDLSLFKVFSITEHSSLRVNVDAFNVFNVQGYVNPDSTTGIQSLRTSYNTPRQLQLSARFTF